ncbi:MAG: glycosyltransferase [Candidatus Babeliales bacterium]|jgi:GT2 family glycosyltransferase
MDKPIVSVVLGTYNRLPFLQLAFASIRAELASCAHEIFVIDGGSDDGTLPWLCAQKDVITIVQHNRGEWQRKSIERRSWGYFMNLGFRAANGTYICMLSDDCVVVPGAINKGVAYFDELRKRGNPVGALAFYWRDWSKSEPYHVGYTLGDKLYVNHGMFLRSALQAVDYIDEDNFFFYNADGDLCLKLWQHGYQVLESRDSYVEHYPHANVAVRSSNYVRFKSDLKNYLSKWEGTFYDRRKNNCGHIAERAFKDVTATGDIFLSLHRLVLQKNPRLEKPVPAWKRNWRALLSKTRSVMRRMMP